MVTGHTRLLELIICFLPLLVCFMRRLAPAVVYFCHSGNCPEPLAGLSLQLLALVGGVVWQRDGQRRGVMLLRPGHGHCVSHVNYHGKWIVEKEQSEGDYQGPNQRPQHTRHNIRLTETFIHSPSHFYAADAQDGDECPEEHEAGHGQHGDLHRPEGGLLVAPG